MSFKTRIGLALANPDLQAALDRNAERRLKVRTAAYDSLHEAEAVRDRARAIRVEVLAHLADDLEQFAAQVERRGGHVHWAADAAEARAIVLGIAREHGVRLVAKSKSMVGEEIEINRALLEAGITPVETDLGEYIVQLRGETPSHIITPAVHLRRQDVAHTFHRELGMPLTDDVAVMTALARRTLRETFLTAGMGLSGVNFGVAETGALCLVTNEGNGRMVTTLPPVHVALMGMERLAPTLADLAVLLKVLPRSATGQKITSYVSLIHGARRAGEPDGPNELHVVILDNGRSRVLASDLAESLLCIRCGACLNACPVFREIGGHAYASPYPGPIGAVLTPALGGAADFGELAHASTLCGACQEACPVRIDLPAMLVRVRARHVREALQPAWLRWGMRLWHWVMADAQRYATAQRAAAGLGRLLGGSRGFSYLPPLDGWTRQRDLPPLARESFRERMGQRTK